VIECSPSRFLEELPEEDLEWQGRGDDDPKKNEAQGQATLAGLKGMFEDF
jgi:ATP-dependent DNA helicase Rep